MMRFLILGVLFIGCDNQSVAPVDGGTSKRVDGGSGLDGGIDLDHTAAGLTAFVQSGEHRSWRAETAIHPSSGPHGGNVRSYVNELLYASLKAGNTTHPPGSAVVKELYGSGTTITGYAIDAKDASGRWFFLEAFGPAFTNPYYFQGVTNFCANCHTPTLDFYAGLPTNLP